MQGMVVTMGSNTNPSYNKTKLLVLLLLPSILCNLVKL